MKCCIKCIANSVSNALIHTFKASDQKLLGNIDIRWVWFTWKRPGKPAETTIRAGSLSLLLGVRCHGRWGSDNRYFVDT